MNHSQVTADFADFAIPINITGDTDLYDHALTTGDDICFTDSTETIQLNHEIEYWTRGVSSVDTLIWVNVSSLDTDADTTIYMYYGNATASNQEDITGTWNANYTMVHHLAESDIDGGTGDIKDSTLYDNDGTTHGMTTADDVSGKLGICFDFDGTGDWVSVEDTSSLEENDFTLSCWFQPHAVTVIDALVAKWYVTEEKSYYICVYDYDSDSDYEMRYEIWESSTVFIGENVESVVNLNDSWYQATLTFDSSIGKAILYMDGEQVQTTTTAAVNSIDDTIYNFTIGARKDGEEKWIDALIDEVVYLKDCMSADWVETTYNSQNNVTDGGFYSIGSEQELATGNLPIVTTNDATGVEETNATIQGTLTNNGSTDTTCWFQYGDETPPTDNNVSQGVIANQSTFNYNWQSLTPGVLYYFDTEANNSDGWDTTGGIKSFLTKPNTPTSASCSTEEGWINVSWTAATGADRYHVRYKSDSSPTSITDGTLFDNVTVLYVNKSIGAGTYYFSIWSYAYESSPALHHYSDTYDTTSGTELTVSTWHSKSFGGSVTIEEINTSVDAISSYIQTSSPLQINVTGSSALDNVTLYYRYSTDNSSWSDNYYFSDITRAGYVLDNASLYLDYPNSVTIVDDKAYVACYNEDALEIFNVSNAMNPVSLGEIHGTGSPNYLNGAHDIVVIGDIAYVVSYNDNEFVTFNISNPASISVLDNYPLAGQGMYLIVEDNLAYVTAKDTDLVYIFNVTDPSNIVEVNSFNTSISGDPWHLYKIDDILYVLPNADGVRVYNVSNPENEVYVTGWNNTINMRELREYNNSGFNYLIGTYNHPQTALVVYNITDNKTHPTFKKIIDFNQSGAFDIEHNYVFVHRNTIETADDGGILVWNLTNLDDPTFEGGIYGDGTPNYLYNLHEIEVDNPSTLYALSQDDDSLVIFNITYTRGGWTKWNDVSNPDDTSPWSWNFNFPNGAGYYEFYSIGNMSGSPNETAPSSADEICRYMAAFDIEVNSTIWVGGAPLCGTSIQKNFTFYQNGSSTIDVKIGFNNTNYTYVNWSTYNNDGFDQYTANFTIDTWSSEINIEPKSGVDPVTTLKASVSGESNFTFGIRLWIPKFVSIPFTDLTDWGGIPGKTYGGIV